MCARPGRRSCAPISARPRCCSSISARGANRLGGSSLAQVYGELGATPPGSRRSRAAHAARRGARGAARAEPGARLSRPLRRRRVRDARGDGFRRPLRPRRQTTAPAPNGAAGALFSEELGVVLQVKAEARRRRRSRFSCGTGWASSTHAHRRAHARDARAHRGGAPAASMRSWEDLRRAWSETSCRMRELRDEPGCAREEFAAACDTGAPGLNVALTFDPNEDVVGAVHRHRAAEGGRAARAGRQQPDRDGGGVRARGLRAARRAHERRARRGA